MTQTADEFDRLVHKVRYWRSTSDPDVYDFMGCVHLLLACLDNLRENALEAELEDIGDAFEPDQVAFIARIAEYAEKQLD